MSLKLITLDLSAEKLEMFHVLTVMQLQRNIIDQNHRASVTDMINSHCVRGLIHTCVIRRTLSVFTINTTCSPVVQSKVDGSRRIERSGEEQCNSVYSLVFSLNVFLFHPNIRQYFRCIVLRIDNFFG